MTLFAAPPRQILLLAVGLGLVVVGVSSCGRFDSVATTAPTGTDNTVPMPLVTTEMVDQGAAPRLRLNQPAPVGTRRRATVTVHRDMLQQVDNQPEEHFLTPDVTIPLTATAGSGRIDLVVGASTSTDPTLTGKLAPTQGTRAELVTDESGAVVRLRLHVGPTTTPDARAALERCLTQAMLQQIVFPDTPVGAGAVWLIHREIPGRIPVEQTTTARLLANNDGVLRVAVDVEQRPAGDTMLGAMTQNDIAPITGTPVRGSGTFVIDRRLPLPISGDITIDGDHRYLGSSGAIQLRQTTAIRVTWSH